MKANINGIVLEGSPEEIVKYQSLIKENSKNDYFLKFKGMDLSQVNIEEIAKEIEKLVSKKPFIVGKY